MGFLGSFFRIGKKVGKLGDRGLDSVSFLCCSENTACSTDRCHWLDYGTITQALNAFDGSANDLLGVKKIMKVVAKVLIDSVVFERGVYRDQDAMSILCAVTWPRRWGI